MTDPYQYDEARLLEEAYDAEPPVIEASSTTPWVPPNISVDVTHLYTTNQVFDTRDDLIKWARDVSKAHGYVLVITRSDKGNMGKTVFVTLMCERHGVYKPYKNPEEFKYKKTGSKKCACPFRLKGRPIVAEGGWRLKVKFGFHNHEAAEDLVGHSYAGRLTKEEKVHVEKMAKDWVAPRHMLSSLKEEFPGNKSTITQVYTACKTWRQFGRGPMTEMQHLLKKLQEANYVHFERQEDNSEVVTGLFWAHPDAVKLFNTFPQVVIMDCTYKTNKYRIPLLEMVGLTSTNMTYSIAFCYMSQERTDDYVWALECMKSLLFDPARLPGVIVTDKELALLNAIEQIFPTATHLLCMYHINKNVEAKCKLWVDADQFYDVVMDNWRYVIYAETVEQYEECWSNMCSICSNFVKFTYYLATTWLSHKEKFVKAWTNNVMHLGTTTSNRAEGAHASLKMMLKNSKGDLCESWDAVHRLTIGRHNEIKASFKRSINITDHTFKDPFYTNVRGFVSRKALQLMHAEMNRKFGYLKECGCLLKVTHGLPCSCSLASFRRIPYEAIHPFWKSLSWHEVPVGDEDISACGALQKEFDGVTGLYVTLDASGKSMIRRKVKQIYCPESSSLCSPTVKVKSKSKQKKKESDSKAPRGQSIGSLRRDPSYFEIVDNLVQSERDSNATPSKATCPPPAKPRKSKIKKSTSVDTTTLLRYLPRLPSYFHQSVEHVIDVMGDGNCGYRAVALGLEHAHGEEGYRWVREQLLSELWTHNVLYIDMFGQSGVDDLERRITLGHDEVAYEHKWMQLPEMGYLIATRFQVVFISISATTGSYTYLPLRGSGVPETGHRVLVVGHVPGHYVLLRCFPDHFVPPIAPQWRPQVKGPSSLWDRPYRGRLAQSQQILSAWYASTGGHPPPPPPVVYVTDITED